MRAWQVQSHGEPADVLVQVELEEPKPGPGQVAIRVTAAGIGLPGMCPVTCRGFGPLTPAPELHPGTRRAWVWSRLLGRMSTCRSGLG